MIRKFTGTGRSHKTKFNMQRHKTDNNQHPTSEFIISLRSCAKHVGIKQTSPQRIPP